MALRLEDETDAHFNLSAVKDCVALGILVGPDIAVCCIMLVIGYPIVMQLFNCQLQQLTLPHSEAGTNEAGEQKQKKSLSVSVSMSLSVCLSFFYLSVAPRMTHRRVMVNP